MPTEFVMSVDDFNQPQAYTGEKAIALVLTRLLLLEPGTIQSHPDMGVGLVSKYRYSLEGSEYELRSDYQSQIEKYLPQFQNVKVDVKIEQKLFKISVVINKDLYVINYDEATSQTSVTYGIKLSDL